MYPPGILLVTGYTCALSNAGRKHHARSEFVFWISGDILALEHVTGEIARRIALLYANRHHKVATSGSARRIAVEPLIKLTVGAARTQRAVQTRRTLRRNRE
jgi:hypothetical protein